MLKFYGLIFLLCTQILGCAYTMGKSGRTLPHGFKSVAIPVFKNLTNEKGLEASFTEALALEFQRGRVAHVVADPNHADSVIEGVIKSVKFTAGGLSPRETTGAVLASQYGINILVEVRLLRGSDRTVVWSSDFSSERTFVAAQVTEPGFNTVDALYTASSKRSNITTIAQELMSEAHERLTENF